MATFELPERSPLLPNDNVHSPVQETNIQPQAQTAGANAQGRPVAGGSGTGRSTARQNSSPNPQRGSGTQDGQERFKKKICTKFLPSRRGLEEYGCIEHLNADYLRENIRCKCGLPYTDHDKDAITNNQGLYELVEDLLKKEISVREFTRSVYEGEEGERLQRGYKWKTHNDDPMGEADGAEMGEIEFQMDHSRTLRSKFTRLSDETDMSELKLFLKDRWKLLEAEPELIISLIGTTANKALADKLAEGILKISRYVNVIILTSGLENDIVAKKIGDAVTREPRWTTEGETQSKAKIRCVGITSWGSLKRKPEKNGNGKYTIKANVSSPVQQLVFNPGHSYLLLVDNGTTEELPFDLNTFWAKLEKCLKTDSLRVMNLILGNKKYEKKHLAMTETLLQYGFPVIFLQHSEKYLDILIDGVLLFQQEETLDTQSVVSQLTNTDKDKQMAEKIEKFLIEQLKNDANGQRKNVITICDLLSEDSNDSEVGHNLDSIMLRTFTKPSIVIARVNNREPDHDSVLQILKLAMKWRCWDVSMDQLLLYKYTWTPDEMKKLKDIFKDCLLQDRPNYISVFNQDGWLPMETFLSLEMLAELYTKPQQLVNDPLQAVYKRKKIKGDIEHSIKMMVYDLMLPDCYLTEFNQGLCAHPYKDLLIWAVLSKKWNIVKHILHSQKDDILVWILATAYLCKAVALRQLDVEIRNEYKGKQHYYEEQGMKLLEDLGIKHGNRICQHPKDPKSNTTYPHLSLETTSEKWGELCPADLALLGNFKTFVRSEAFHNYIVKRWKQNVKEPECCCSYQPRVKFYTHWVGYMIMVLTFCAVIISRPQENHYAHQIWLGLWISSYLLGEVITRRQQQKKVKFCSKRQQLLLIIRKYLHLLLLFLFLIGGCVCTSLGIAHWGGMSYGLACLILILGICGHFLSAFHLFAPQISILKKAVKEILTFMILIILLIWSVTMIFQAVLCLDQTSADAKDSTRNQTLTNEVASGGWGNALHAAFFLYLSLYGEYSFDLNVSDSGHLFCVADKEALMWVSYVLIGLHILIGNVLLMNLLVSVIGTKTGNLQSDLVYVWKSNWYKLTLHYEKQTILPPPFNIGELFVRLVCCCIGKCGPGVDQTDAPTTMHHSPTTQNLQRYQQEALQALSDQAGQDDTRI